MSFQLQLEMCLRVFVATALSAVVGFEREHHGHAAGLRTHMLVGLGAAMFTVLSLFAFAPGDPGRVAAQIVVGVSFLGAGTIIQRRDERNARGLTTAAGIWAVAAIGMACGAGAYLLGAFSAALILFVLAVLARLSDRINPRMNAKGQKDKTSDDASNDDEEAGEIPDLHRKTFTKGQRPR